MHWLRNGAIAAAAVVAGVAVMWAVSRRGGPEVAFETAGIDRGGVAAKVTATGTVSALVTVQVGSQVSGRIQALYADFNDAVHKGEILAKLDPQLYDAALEQARANELAAEANLAKAKTQAADADRTRDREQALFDRQLIAKADLDTAQTAVDVAKANIGAARGAVSQATAALHQAQVNLRYTTIRSPIDGVVVSRNVDAGQTVAAAFQSPTLFVIAENLRRMQVDTSVSEADVGKLRGGMPASFHVDAYPEETFTGKVREIRYAPQTVQNVVTYDAVIDVENDGLKLRPGMTANVVFVVRDVKDAVRVPNAALRFTLPPELQTEYGVRPAVSETDTEHRNVWLLRNDKPVAVAITPGITDGSRTVVVAGDVRPGDLAVTDVPPSEQKGFRLFGGR